MLPTGLWRALASAAIALTLVLVIGDLVHSAPGASYGFRLESDGRVREVDPHSSAANAGIVAGDIVTVTGNRFGNRVNFAEPQVAPGTQVSVRVQHAGQERPVALVAKSAGTSRSGAESSVVISAFGLIRIVFLLIAAIVVMRRSERPDARALASFFIAFGGGSLQRWPWYPASIAAALIVVRPVVVTFALVQAVRFSALFPHSSSHGLRRGIERSISRCAAPGMLAVAALNVVSLLDVRIPGPLITAASVLFTLTTLAIFIALAIGFGIGAREASAADRPRLRWVALSIGIGLGALVPIALLESLGIEPTFLLPLILLVAAIPIGTAYAILRHQLLDIRFVVNRALVFAAVSATVVALFTLLEFVVGKYVTTLGHIQSLALEALAALAIGASLRGMHDRADAFVDVVIFRARHRAERALRRLTREAPYVFDRDVLARRVTSAVERHADARFVALYVREKTGDLRLLHATPQTERVERIDRDDPAVVRARASGEPVDLQELAGERAPSGVPGMLAFPMIVRGELAGLVACGQKRSDETYAPDERAVLRELVQAIGTAFDTLETLALRQAVDTALDTGDLAQLRIARDAQ